jgi:hypothetical protein
VLAGQVHGRLEEGPSEAGAAGVRADPELLEAGVRARVVERVAVAELGEAVGRVAGPEDHRDLAAGELGARELGHLLGGRLGLVVLGVEVVHHPADEGGVLGAGDAEVVLGHGVAGSVGSSDGPVAGSVVGAASGVSVGSTGAGSGSAFCSGLGFDFGAGLLSGSVGSVGSGSATSTRNSGEMLPVASGRSANRQR